MFNSSGDAMDVTSPDRPENQKNKNNTNQNTLPAFLLGTDSNFNQDNNNKHLFNNTPLKGKSSSSNNKIDNPSVPSKLQANNLLGSNLDIENRPPLLFSSRYGQNSNKQRPFSSNQFNQQNSVSNTGPPVASLGVNSYSKNTSSNPYVMASSPLPEKQGHLPRITTPDFSNSHIDNSPILTSPVPKNQKDQAATISTPLSRQVLEKRQNLKNKNEESVSNMSFPPEEEIDCWVSLFGFNSRNREKIIKKLTTCGSIVCRQPSRKSHANWIHLRFASSNQAKRARQKFNCVILESECTAIGVVECLEPGYILDYIKGCGNVSGVNNNVTMGDYDDASRMLDVSKVGMRSLVESNIKVGNNENKQNIDEIDPFNVPQQESNSVVRRTLTYLLPNYF